MQENNCLWKRRESLEEIYSF